MILDTNTIKVKGRGHTTWCENQKLINRWTTGKNDVLILLSHISGFEDMNIYGHVPSVEEWNIEIRKFNPPRNVVIKVEGDCECHKI